MLTVRDRWHRKNDPLAAESKSLPTCRFEGPSSMPHRKLASRLEAAVGLSEEDRGLLGSLPKVIRAFADGEPILRAGDRPHSCGLLVEGFAVRQQIVADTNQILALYVPGDAPDLHTLHIPVMDHELASAGGSTVAFISHADLRTALAASPSLTNALWRETLIDAAIYREWVASLGARDALGRVSHLLCELAFRLAAVGLVQDGAFELPFTQVDLADACGLSAVHVNRTLQELRHRELISWHGKTVVLLNRAELEAVADFDASYLHLGGR
jgi:CRP-like cAMP-binding protein